MITFIKLTGLLSDGSLLLLALLVAAVGTTSSWVTRKITDCHIFEYPNYYCLIFFYGKRVK